MKYGEFSIDLLVQNLTEKAMKASTPPRNVALMLEAAEVIQQLRKEISQLKKEKTP